MVQWDKNGIYSLKEGELFLSKDMGKTWTLAASGLKDAENLRVSPDGRWIAFSKPVAAEKILGTEIYDDVKNSTAQVYTDLNYRHWDAWNEGKVNHVFIAATGDAAAAKDIMTGEPYDSPQKPFGGSEDFVFSPDSKTLVYVSKKKKGKEYAQSTNTDIYAYDIAAATTTNWSEGMMGYDQAPAFSTDGKKIAWLSMKRDGFEADKNDIVVMDIASKAKLNMTTGWDETVDGGFAWSTTGSDIYFNAAIKGTVQLFSVRVPSNLMVRMLPVVRQVTQGDFDVTGIAGQQGNSLW